jgi:hypothetical protein
MKKRLSEQIATRSATPLEQILSKSNCTLLPQLGKRVIKDSPAFHYEGQSKTLSLGR